MMFRWFLAGLACAGILTPLGASAAPAKAGPTQITVTGQGTASAMPDMATETFTIATNAQSASSAASDNNARYDRLLRGLEGLGIAHADIRTTSYNVNYTPPPETQPQPAGAPIPPVRERSGYFVYRGITVTLHRLPLVGKAIDTAIASGVTDIGGVAFGISDRKGQLALALRSAVRDGLAQAQAMAAAAGLRIVRVRFMQQGFASPPTPMVRMASAAPAPPTQIEPGSVETQATVTITYDAQ
jgi:uncharacterized protein YggE